MESKDLRKAGLKVTGPRLKILEILEGRFSRGLASSWNSGVLGWTILMGSWLYLIVAGLSYGILI